MLKRPKKGDIWRWDWGNDAKDFNDLERFSHVLILDVYDERHVDCLQLENNGRESWTFEDGTHDNWKRIA